MFNGSYNVSSTKLNPAPPDPIQAKIFMFFPLFLTVILAPFPSGWLFIGHSIIFSQ